MNNLRFKGFGISLLSIVIITLLNLMLFAYIFFWLQKETLKDAQSKAQLSSKEIIHKIELYFRDALTINKTYSNNFLLYKKLKIPRNDVYNLVKGSITQNKSFLAIWTMWEPNAYDNSDKIYEGDSIHDSKGSFAIAYYYDNYTIKKEINDTLDYFEDFYTIPSKIKQPIILDPFHYQYHGNPKVYYETSLVSPILEDNKFIGVIGIDIDLQMLQDSFKNIKVFENGFISILSNSGHIVTHPNDTVIDSNLSLYLSEQNKPILDLLKKGRAFSINGYSEFSDKRVVRFFYPINMEYLVAPWYIMVEMTEAEIYTYVNKLRNIGFVILLIVIGLSAYLFISIIKREKAERDLKDSEVFNKLLFQDSYIPIVVMEPESGRFIDCNEAAAKIYGFSTKADLLQKTPVDVSSEIQEDGLSMEVARDRISETLSKGFKSFEWLHKRPNGELWWGLVYLMMFEYKGKKLIQFTLQDITQRKKVEEEIKTYQSHLEELVAQRTNEIAVLNEELMQSNNELQSINENLYNQKEELTNTLEKLKETQEQLIQSEKMASIGILTAGVAHEINNPLNFIQSGLFSLESIIENIKHRLVESGNYDNIQKIFSHMNIGISRVSEIVTSLSRFSRKTNDVNQICPIHSIIDNCLVILNNMLKNKCSVEKKYYNEEILIKGNEGKLHQVFINIISNSVQSFESFGTISITTNISGNEVLVSIVDNGNGIATEYLNKIFDPFFTTKEPGKGTGLGLSIVYSIVKEHNGQITINSQLNKGTEVIIQLPLHKNNG